jgi:hypothetical protein
MQINQQNLEIDLESELLVKLTSVDGYVLEKIVTRTPHLDRIQNLASEHTDILGLIRTSLLLVHRRV